MFQALSEMLEQVSGSADLSTDYEEAKSAKNTADEKTYTNHKQKNIMSTEKKQFKEQKEEAEKFNKLLKEQVHFSQ